MHIFVMTDEPTFSDNEIFDADNHDQETKKSYSHTFDDDSVHNMRQYFKVEDEHHDTFLRYLKNRKVPGTTPNDV